MLGMAREAIAHECFSRLADAVRVVPPELGEDVSLAGAQPLVSSRINDPAWRRNGSVIRPSFASPGSDMSVHASGFGRA